MELLTEFLWLQWRNPSFQGTLEIFLMSVFFFRRLSCFRSAAVPLNRRVASADFLCRVDGKQISSSGSRHHQHAVQRDPGQCGFVRRHLDLVDDPPLPQVFQGPRQMLRIDALHG